MTKEWKKEENFFAPKILSFFSSMNGEEERKREDRRGEKNDT